MKIVLKYIYHIVKNIGLFNVSGIIGKQNSPKIIAFSLYGNSERYIDGAIENLKLYLLFLPDWQCRFYVASDLSKIVIEKMVNLGAQVYVMKKKGLDSRYTNWRFMTVFDSKVDCYLIRDCDSLLSMRELTVINNWLASKMEYLIIRDHPFHGIEIPAGLWGGFTGDRINYWQFKWYPFKNYYGNDQKYLSKCIYPKIKGYAYIMDNFHFFQDELVHTLEYDMQNLSFVGCIDTDLELRELNLAKLKELINVRK